MRRTRRVAAFLAVAFSLTTLVSVVVSGAGGGSSTQDASAAPFLKIGKAHPAEAYPSLNSKKPIFILVLGSDSRSKKWGIINHGHADSIHLVGLNPAKDEASILGFPRDSWVNIAGHGENKINDAMSFGGPAGMIAQIEGMTGIHIDYYALTSFFNFKSFVHDIGGVTVNVPYNMDDPYSKAHFKKGRTEMSGKQALAFSRDRHDPLSGDFGRSYNQGTMMLSLLAGYQQDFKKNPALMLNWMGDGMRNAQMDIPYDEFLTLAFTASQIPRNKITNFVVPGSTGMVGAESVVHLSSSANAIYADMKPDGFIAHGYTG